MQTTIELVPGLPHRELIERIYFHHRRGEVAERALAFYLLDMQERGAFAPERDAARWAWKHLGRPRADKLILLARRLEELPQIDATFERGEVPWTKCWLSQVIVGSGRAISSSRKAAERRRYGGEYRGARPTQRGGESAGITL